MKNEIILQKLYKNLLHHIITTSQLYQSSWTHEKLRCGIVEAWIWPKISINDLKLKNGQPPRKRILVLSQLRDPERLNLQNFHCYFTDKNLTFLLEAIRHTHTQICPELIGALRRTQIYPENVTITVLIVVIKFWQQLPQIPTQIII